MSCTLPVVFLFAFAASHRAEGKRHHGQTPGTEGQKHIGREPELGLTSVQQKQKDRVGMVHDGLSAVGGIIEAPLGGKEFGDVFGVKKNAEGDMRAFLSAFVFGTFMLFFTITIFTVLRKCSPSIYAHRVLQSDTGGEQSLPPSHDGCFGWAMAAWRVTDDEVMQASGLDALMFLEFCRLFMKLGLFLSPLVIGVLCPIHFYTPKVECSLFASTESCIPSRCVWTDPDLKVAESVGRCQAKYAKDWLSFIGINGLLQGQEPLAVTPFWIHAGIVWIVACLTLYLTYNTHLRFLKHRFQWLSHIPEPRSTTLMVECIPPEYRSDEKLRSYFNHLFTESAIDKAYIVRKTQPLCKLVSHLEHKEMRLKEVEKQWERDGRHPDRIPKVRSVMGTFTGGASNAIEVYTQQVRDLKVEVAQERQRVEEAVAHMDPSVVSSSGFVTFTSRRWCRHASREQYREDTREWVVGMPPDPVDVVYTDLAKTPDAQERGNVFSVLLLALMFIIWTPLVAITSFLTSLGNLSTLIPVLGVFCKSHPFVENFLQGVLATFALKFLMGWLPVFLMAIIRQFFTLKSGAWAQLKLQSRFFIFQITFVLFVTTIGVSIVKTLEKIIEHPQSIIELLAARLPEASHFYLNYVLLGWFTASVELLRAPQMLIYLWNTRVTGMDAEMARLASEPEDQDCYGMGARFGKVELIMVLMVVFSSVMPLICLIGSMFFFLCNIIFAYLFVFAETKKPDLGGAFWMVSLRHILFALVLYVALMGGILSSQGTQGRYPAAAIFPVFLVLFLAWRRLHQFSWEILPFETVADVDHDFNKRKRDSKLGKMGSKISDGFAGFSPTGCYVQPECLEDCELE